MFLTRVLFVLKFSTGVRLCCSSDRTQCAVVAFYLRGSETEQTGLNE